MIDQHSVKPPSLFRSYLTVLLPVLTLFNFAQFIAILSTQYIFNIISNRAALGVKYIKHSTINDVLIN